jgi:hypothetical protein
MKRIVTFTIILMALAACTSFRVQTPEPAATDIPQVNMLKALLVSSAPVRSETMAFTAPPRIAIAIVTGTRVMTRLGGGAFSLVDTASSGAGVGSYSLSSCCSGRFMLLSTVTPAHCHLPE